MPNVSTVFNIRKGKITKTCLWRAWHYDQPRVVCSWWFSISSRIIYSSFSRYLLYLEQSLSKDASYIFKEDWINRTQGWLNSKMTQSLKSRILKTEMKRFHWRLKKDDLKENEWRRKESRTTPRNKIPLSEINSVQLFPKTKLATTTETTDMAEETEDCRRCLTSTIKQLLSETQVSVSKPADLG